MSPLPVTMRFNSSRQEITSSLEGRCFDCFGVAEFLGCQCFFFIFSGFDDFGVQEVREEVWWEYFGIHRGIVVFALGINLFRQG
jgi:hypothetical protein